MSQRIDFTNQREYAPDPVEDLNCGQHSGNQYNGVIELDDIIEHRIRTFNDMYVEIETEDPIRIPGIDYDT